MAAVAVTQSEDDRVRSLAYDILTTQQNQVGQMQGWLSCGVARCSRSATT